MLKGMTKRENEVLDRIIDVLKKHLDPERVMLFGSRTRPRFSRNSDFDLAVDRKRVDIRLQRKIREDIEEASGLYKVDIVFLDSVERDFKEIVLKTGKIVYEKESSTRYTKT